MKIFFISTGNVIRRNNSNNKKNGGGFKNIKQKERAWLSSDRRR